MEIKKNIIKKKRQKIGLNPPPERYYIKVYDYVINQQLPKSLMEKVGLFSGMFPAWRNPRVRDTSPAVVVPNLISVDPPALALLDVVP